MKYFGVIALSGLAAFAAAAPQDSAATSTSVALTPSQKCVNACDPTDICCAAGCVGVPCPDEGMANSTTECAAKCPQGSGTPADTEKFSKCVSDCIHTEFFTGSMPSGPQSTSAPSSGSDSGSNSDSGSDSTATGTNSAGETGSPTESGSATTSTGAAGNIQVGASAAGVVGLLMAALAL